MKQGKQGIYARYIKRLLDICLSGCALIVLSPVLLIVAVLVRTKLGSPVIFSQERPGKDEKIFKMYKFRSMTDARDENGELLPDEVRLTKFGRTLRSTSLDELPELWNIFKGDMSIVGPRPLLVRDVAYMDAQQHRRHEVRPGLTGLAQVTGRNALDWDTKLALDVKYVDTCSFIGDVKIFLRTIVKVFRREDIAFETEGYDMDLKDWNERKSQQKQKAM